MKITRFEDLECWQEARKLVNMVYDAIRQSPPFQKDYRLKDQSTGAAITVMGNIPEGFVRRSNREFIQFLFISLSSAAELQSHMYAAVDQHYISEETFDGIYQQADKTARLISGLITYLRESEERYKQSRLKELKKPDGLKKPDRPVVQTRASGENELNQKT
jgi:four helix bundle protein